MDNDTLIDLKLKVKFRLSEYLEKAKLPLDKSDPENLRTICPCCSRYAKVLCVPLDPPQYFWSCPECKAEGDAVKYAKEYFGMKTEEQAIVDVCRKLGIQISALSTITAEELIRKDFDPLLELIQGMLAPGLYILAGASKIGKSWLVLQIAHHIRTEKP